MVLNTMFNGFSEICKMVLNAKYKSIVLDVCFDK